MMVHAIGQPTKTGLLVFSLVGNCLLLCGAAHAAADVWLCPNGDFTYLGTSLKVVANAYYIYVGESETFTARYNDDYSADLDDLDDNPTPYYRGDPDKTSNGTRAWGSFLSPPVEWSADGGSFSSTSTVTTTWTAPSTVGDYGVRLYVKDDPNVYRGDHSTGKYNIASITVHSVKVVQSGIETNDLWWFNGANASNYSEQVTLTASGVTEGCFKWEVTAGSSKVDLNNGSGDSDTITATNDNTVVVKSTDGSSGVDDVTIKFSYGANAGSLIEYAQHKMTVYEPYEIRRDDSKNVHDPQAPQGGYESNIHMEVWSRWGVLTNRLEVNEHFTSGLSVDIAPPHNWSQPTNHNGNLFDPSGFRDFITAPWHESYEPEMQNPQTPLGTTKVDHWTGDWHAGSVTIGDGVKVDSANVWQRYLDHAMHE